MIYYRYSLHNSKICDRNGSNIVALRRVQELKILATLNVNFVCTCPVLLVTFLSSSS